MSRSFLSLNDISYVLPNGHQLFQGVSLNVYTGCKCMLVGENGVGKSTLCQIIRGNIFFQSGILSGDAQIYYLPQLLFSSGTIAEVMGLKPKFDALLRVEQGLTEDDDFEIIGNSWSLLEILRKEFELWGIAYLDAQACFADLSGGEKEKVMLIAAFLSSADILLLDEPTNNLDAPARQLFLQKMRDCKKGMLIVSHDRELLQQADEIAELTADGINLYGGNYDFYCEQKQLAKQNLQMQVTLLDKENKRLIQQKMLLQEQAAHKASYGEKQVANHRYSRMAGAAMALSAQNSQGKKKSGLEVKLSENRETSYALGLKLKEELIKIPLPEKPFIKERAIEIVDLCFGFGQLKLFNHFNLLMKGNDRAAFCAGNGVGKTTLLKLLLGELSPESGKVKLNVRAVYLNQDLSLLNKDKSLLDNLMELNPGLSVNQAYSVLANFKFRNELALKMAGCLSGGELLKASLAAVLGTPKQPEMLILDEPTNNLDIKSMEILEEALLQYQGALLVVSHDKTFLENIGIEKFIYL